MNTEVDTAPDTCSAGREHKKHQSQMELNLRRKLKRRDVKIEEQMKKIMKVEMDIDNKENETIKMDNNHKIMKENKVL